MTRQWRAALSVTPLRSQSLFVMPLPCRSTKRRSVSTGVREMKPDPVYSYKLAFGRIILLSTASSLLDQKGGSRGGARNEKRWLQP